MKPTTLKILFFLCLQGILAHAQNREIPFTQDDRDRLIRYEEKFKAIDQRFDAIDQRFESLEKSLDYKFESIESKLNFNNSLLVAFILGVFGLIGFMIWDRRTMLAPYDEKIEKISNRVGELEKLNARMTELERKIESRAG